MSKGLVTAWFLASFFASGVAARGGTLEDAIRGLISKHGFASKNVAVAVISDRSKLLVAINEGKPFKPASNQKILTTAAAIHLLGPEHEYETTISATAHQENGRITGDLIIRSTGDPNISGRFYHGDPAALFSFWARGLFDGGLRRIEGDLIADDTFFDDQRLLPSWDRGQEMAWYSAQISALNINDNCLDVTVRPARRAGRPASVRFVPACSLIRIEGTAKTVAKGKTKVLVHRIPGTNRLTVGGQIRLRGSPWKGNITMDDPALVFVSVLEEALKGAGIERAGGVRKKARPVTTEPVKTELTGPVQKSAPGDKAPAAGAAETILVRHTSTLLKDLPIILKRSQNLHAEVLLKALGAQVGGEGSLRGGGRALRKFLGKKGISDEVLVVGDGSGLSHENRVSAKMLVRILHSVRSESYFGEYLQSLPVAGKDGTLDDRFRGSLVREKVFAKTGYIHGVSCLSGYVVKEERVWSFSVLVNGLKGGAGGAKKLQEKVAERVYRSM